MDRQHDEPPPPTEGAIREMLERSLRDIAEGRTAPLAPVLDRMRASAEDVRNRRLATTRANRRSA